MRLKHLLSNEKVNLRVGPFGSALSTKEYTDEGPWVYTQRIVLDNNFSKNPNHVTNEKYAELESFSVLPDDILITTRGTLGRIAIVPEGAPKGILHPCIIKFRTNPNLIRNHLLLYLFNYTDLAMNQIRKKAEGATIDALYSGQLKDIYIPIPPANEQEKIISIIDARIERTDDAIRKHKMIIAKLEEYRKSIIYQAVTGKIDCRKEAV